MSKEKNNRDKIIKFRTTETEYQAILTTANDKNCSVSQLLRSLCTTDGAGDTSHLSPDVIEIARNHTLCQVLNMIQFLDIPEGTKKKIMKELNKHA